MRIKSDTCYHCGEPVPADLRLDVTINGANQAMCCLGCQAVAQQIMDFGFGDYYKHRTEFPQTPDVLVPESLKELTIFNNPQLQSEFVRQSDENTKEARLIIEGISCPACTWLIESRLQITEGISKIEVNYSTQRCSVSWQDDVLNLSDILTTIIQLGYKAYPFNAKQRETIYEAERKTQLLRLGIAGLFGMQVMMIAIALYFGAAYGIDDRYKDFFHWISLLLTLPVLLYSGAPLFLGAVRDIRVKRPGMDVPISLGIGIAFISSIWATAQQGGHVYFDSIVMFIFFILGGRYFEFISRKKSIAHLDKMSSLLPLYATRLNEDDKTETVLLDDIVIGDNIIVKPGEVIPIDGIVRTGASSVNESIITGESIPIHKTSGIDVIGGSTNIESPLTIEVRHIGSDTFLSNISRIIEQAANKKSKSLLLANKIVSIFIIFILSVASLTAYYWYHNDPRQWLDITIAVLVVSCPCALSLATPTALSSSASTLIRHGIALINNDAIELLGKVRTIVFDKTGTLTEGKLQLERIDIINKRFSEDDVIPIAKSLELTSEHPVAKAINNIESKVEYQSAIDVKNHPGQGIQGVINHETWYIGTETFIAQMLEDKKNDIDESNIGQRRILLANNTDGIVACLYFNDSLRDTSHALVQSLKRNNKDIILMSGDHHSVVKQIADELEITQYEAELKPDEKLEQISELQNQGNNVCMIGDGINDAPAFAQADVAIAMTEASDIAKLNADMLLLTNQIDTIKTLLKIITKTNHTVRMNFAWAIGYNLTALPFAVCGYVAPWMAALGMSLSSLIVVLNATRISTNTYN